MQLLVVMQKQLLHLLLAELRRDTTGRGQMLLQLRWLVLHVLYSVRMLRVPWWQHRCTSHRCDAHPRVQQALTVGHVEEKLDGEK
jgi:hypothetical protein